MTTSWQFWTGDLAKRLTAVLGGGDITGADFIVPPDRKLGDFAFGCFKLAKAMGKSPAEIAKEIASKIDLKQSDFSQAVAAGPYVNFSLNTGDAVHRVVREIEIAGGGCRRSGRRRSRAHLRPGPGAAARQHVLVPLVVAPVRGARRRREQIEPEPAAARVRVAAPLGPAVELAHLDAADRVRESERAVEVGGERGRGAGGEVDEDAPRGGDDANGSGRGVMRADHVPMMATRPAGVNGYLRARHGAHRTTRSQSVRTSHPRPRMTNR
jgi:hypothetical protein